MPKTNNKDDKALKEVRKGDVFRWDFGYGEELVQCAGRSPKQPDIIGFYTKDDGLFVFKQAALAKHGLKFVED